MQDLNDTYELPRKKLEKVPYVYIIASTFVFFDGFLSKCSQNTNNFIFLFVVMYFLLLLFKS